MNRNVTNALTAFCFAGLIAAFASAAEKPAAPKPQALPAVTIPAGQAHIIGASKLIIGDVKENQAFFEKVFGMKEVNHFNAKDTYDEPIMGFGSGARLALFHPLAEAALPKSQAPVSLIYTPDLEAVVQRLDAGKYQYRRLPQSQSSTFKIVIARDPSGNAIEILERTGKPFEVGGAKLIVDDRQKAEDFFAKIFGAKPGQRYVTAGYDEVLMNFGEGPFLALYQPKNEQPLKKSQYPVVAIYTSEFDAVLKRVAEAGLGFREVKSSDPNARIVVAKDPAGNAVEIIKR